MLLMSIKTKYAKEIFNGTKKYEFRRKSIGLKNINEKIYIYSSKEEKAIVGYIIVDEILEGDLDYISKKTKCVKSSTKAYFEGLDKCYALHIKEYHKIDPIKLENIKDKCVIPQFYRYIKPDEFIYSKLKK